MESGAGGLAWLGPSSSVGRGLSRRVSGLGSSPDGDTRPQDKQPPRCVPNDAQQRGVSLAGQSLKICVSILRGRREWVEESR